MPAPCRSEAEQGRLRRHVVPALAGDHACARCPVRLQTFCAILEPDELAAFKSLGSTMRIEAGQCLFHEGDPTDFVFNLTSGALKLYKLLPDGRRQITGFLFPGEFLGITFGEEHFFTAEAVETSDYCRIPRPRFEAFVESHVELERELFQIAAHELRAAQDQFLLLGRKTAAERLATFLSQRFDRARRRNADWEIITLPMNRVDIADYLGLTKETVSRTFSSFRAAGLIRSLPDDRTELVARERLEAIAGGFGEG